MKGALYEKSILLSIEVVKYYQWLTNTKREYVMSKQILRSGTSVGANVHEADCAASDADFVSKMRIALKEASETEYWLTVLERTGYYDSAFDIIKGLLDECKRMVVSSIKTVNGRISQEELRKKEEAKKRSYKAKE